jgi:glutathione peroxidase
MLPWIISLSILTLCGMGCESQKGIPAMASLYDIKVETITGETVPLASYRGKVLLIVNTASKCGFTGQYEGLQTLYTQYADRGFVILGFPSNDFLRQEPGTDEEILSFCKLNYGVTFPLFAKGSVKGRNQQPLYQYLTDKTTNPKFGGKISWNFNKFLIGRDGTILGRFGSRTAPQAPELIAQIESALKPVSVPPANHLDSDNNLAESGEP